MSNQPETVKSVSIQQMTIDLFQFWFDLEFHSIVEGIELPMQPIKPGFTTLGITVANCNEYIRSVTVVWKDDSKNMRTTDVIWMQVNLTKIQVEFTSAGKLATRIDDWLQRRFGVVATEAIPTFSNTAKELTPTEKIVAGYLAEKMSYKAIAGELKIAPGTAKKHAQHIAAKWGTSEVIELLWLEAQQRQKS